jgi:hypothetical protein
VWNPLLEVACDESGSEGENLIGGETDVFAHAGVRLSVESAAECVREIHDRIRSPVLEYKANHLLRQKNRPVLVWLLGPSGPIFGHSKVYLIDKEFFVVGKIADLVGAGPEQKNTLYRNGSGVFGRDKWLGLLRLFTDLTRAKNRRGVTSVDEFFRLVDTLRAESGPLAEIMELLRRARPRIEALRARVLDDPKMIPVLDTLTPAIIRAVECWGEGRNPVSLVHDEQLVLTEERINQLDEILLLHHPPGVRLAGLKLVDSRSDSRVQVADFLAGVARRIASEELNNRGDAELTSLLRPYVDSASIWGGGRW